MKILADKIMEECPQFQSCSAPKCPLDEGYNKRVKLTGEDKCKTHKATRVKISLKYPEVKLICGGLTPQESAGQRQGDRLRELAFNQSNKSN